MQLVSNAHWRMDSLVECLGGSQGGWNFLLLLFAVRTDVCWRLYANPLIPPAGPDEDPVPAIVAGAKILRADAALRCSLVQSLGVPIKFTGIRMAVRPILPITDPLLRQKSARVEAVDDSVRSLVSDMIETMRAADGAGLAAVQIGELRRVLVADIPLDEPYASHRVFINPEIVWRSDEIQEMEGEGCLSMPEIYFKVPRALEVKVRFTDMDAITHEVHAKGFSAVCFQHEIDHLDGIRQVDRVSNLKRDKFLAKFRKYLRSDEYGQKLRKST